MLPDINGLSAEAQELYSAFSRYHSGLAVIQLDYDCSARELRLVVAGGAEYRIRRERDCIVEKPVADDSFPGFYSK